MTRAQAIKLLEALCERRASEPSLTIFAVGGKDLDALVLLLPEITGAEAPGAAGLPRDSVDAHDCGHTLGSHDKMPDDGRRYGQCGVPGCKCAGTAPPPSETKACETCGGTKDVVTGMEFISDLDSGLMTKLTTRAPCPACCGPATGGTR